MLRKQINIVFFLMTLMTYIQVLKVKSFKDTCLTLLTGLKSSTGRREMDSLFHTPNLLKWEKRQVLKSDEWRSPLALVNERNTSVQKSNSK